MSAITKQSILRVLRDKVCLDLRRLSRLLGVRPQDEALSRSLRDLLRKGNIHRVGGTGRRTAFVATSFEH